MSGTESLFTALRLMTLIHEIDLGLTNPEETFEEPYLQIWRYRGTHNDRADDAIELVRELLREKLATYPLEDLGSAVLEQIDSRRAS